MDKKLRKINDLLKDAASRMSEIRGTASDDKKLEIDMKLCWDSTTSIINYIQGMIDDKK